MPTRPAMKGMFVAPSRGGLALLLGALVAVAASGVRTTSKADVAAAARDVASYYGSAFDGRPTASGEIFDMHEMTAAHRTLPFGTKVRVTCVESGRSAVVRINDRGPFVTGRTLDLSYAAARTLGMVGVGVGPVRLEVIADVDSAARPIATRRHQRTVAPQLESVARRLLRHPATAEAFTFRAAGVDLLKVRTTAAPSSAA